MPQIYTRPGTSDREEVISKSVQTLNELGNWFSCNKLSLSPTKCKYAIINRHLQTDPSKTELSIYGKNLTEIRSDCDTTTNSFVGYLLSENLDSKSHIQHIQKKLEVEFMHSGRTNLCQNSQKRTCTLH